MGGDALKKVQTGRPMAIPARAYNAFVDAAVAHQQRQTGQQRSPGAGSSQAGILLARNTSGGDCPRFGVLGVDKPVIGPTATGGNDQSFQNQLAVDGVTPVDPDHRGPFVVLLEPAKPNKIVPACASGVCVVKVNVLDEAHTHADTAPGDVTQLKSGMHGAASILWVEAGVGTKWSLIRLGVAAPLGLLPVRLWRDGGTTDGNTTGPCDRTYTVRTLEATAPTTGGSLLGTALTPLKRRPPTGKLSVPATSGGGVVGLGYFQGSTFSLYDANETLDTEACA